VHGLQITRRSVPTPGMVLGLSRLLIGDLLRLWPLVPAMTRL